jgi:hypothetical protein
MVATSVIDTGCPCAGFSTSSRNFSKVDIIIKTRIDGFNDYACLHARISTKNAISEKLLGFSIDNPIEQFFFCSF